MATVAPIRRVRRWCGSVTSFEWVDVQYLLLGCGGKGVFEQFSEAASQQVERDLEDKDRNDEGCQRIGDAPLVAQKIGEPDTRRVPIDESASLRWCQALATTLGLSV